jgi:hypothetical protein
LGRAGPFLAIGEPLAQPELPGMADPAQLPFPPWNAAPAGATSSPAWSPTATCPAPNSSPGQRARCGKAEEAHAIMKDGLAGGRLPCARFGANAAWWAIMILAFNLHSVMRHLVLGGPWAEKRMKAIRFALIRLPGRVLSHARRLVIRLPAAHSCLTVLLDARAAILALANAPPAAA